MEFFCYSAIRYGLIVVEQMSHFIVVVKDSSMAYLALAARIW